MSPSSSITTRRRRPVNLVPRNERGGEEVTTMEEHDDDDDEQKHDRELNLSAGPQQILPVVQEDDEDENQMVDEAVIWGTDVHVPTATRTFRHFLRTFVSVSHSDRQQQKKQKRENPHIRNDDDDDSTVSSASSTIPQEPFYQHRLLKLSQGIIDPSSLFSTSIPTKNSLELDCHHLYFHSPSCQRFYHQLVKYPQEMVLSRRFLQCYIRSI